MNKTLDKNQILNLLRGEPRQISEDRFWPSNKDRELLYKACEKRSSTVKFTNGKVFSLRYRKVTGSVAWNEYEAVFVYPTDGTFAPCGWFHIKFILREA